jgi:carbamoyltransferase
MQLNSRIFLEFMTQMAPTILGINRTQDASICLINSSLEICSIQKERLTRKKHHWGKVGDLRDWYAKRIPLLRDPIDLVVECYSSDPEIENIAAYDDEVQEVVRFRNEPRKLRISHHLAHLYATYFLSDFDESAVMIIDCAGSPARDFVESFPSQSRIPPNHVEVSSFYKSDRNSINCLTKQTWDFDWENPVGLGCFYFYLTRAVFPGEGNEGKLMGLAPYGNPAALDLPPLIVDRHKVFIPNEWLALFNQKDRFRFFVDGSGSFEDCANLAATGQRYFEDALLKVAEWLHEATGAENLCFAGGTALNCVANGRLLRESPFRNVFVPPSPHDGGTALGCAIYGFLNQSRDGGSFRWVSDFLGPETEDLVTQEQVLRNDPDLVVERPENLIERAVDLIVSDQVVALFQGKSELGPRALGHRSILADPRKASTRAWINEHVKGRELFRPLAPTVLLEAASRFFQIDRPTPFMQFAANVRAEYRSVIPAVTHVDGSARLQTITSTEDPFFYDLIKAFETRTGIGVILNTSLNGRGEPIVETCVEAVACFKKTALDALIVPPLLALKKNWWPRQQAEQA